jgi:hypothetical protein
MEIEPRATVPGTCCAAPVFLHSSAEIRHHTAPPYDFLQTDTERMIVANDSTSFAATGALKCRTLW